MPPKKKGGRKRQGNGDSEGESDILDALKGSDESDNDSNDLVNSDGDGDDEQEESEESEARIKSKREVVKDEKPLRAKLNTMGQPN